MIDRKNLEKELYKLDKKICVNKSFNVRSKELNIKRGRTAYSGSSSFLFY